jgi:hypothetical protein
MLTAPLTVQLTKRLDFTSRGTSADDLLIPADDSPLFTHSSVIVGDDPWAYIRIDAYLDADFTAASLTRVDGTVVSGMGAWHRRR